MTLTKKILQNNWAELAARVLLGGVFVYSSYHKIIAPAEFARIVYGYQLFPAISINLIAVILPFLELYAGMALLLGIYPRSAALIVNGMLIGFIFAITVNLIRGVEFDCGCFSLGRTGHTGYTVQLLIRDLFFFIMGLHVIFFNQPRKWTVRET
jgi:putative oxidoreductase